VQGKAAVAAEVVLGVVSGVAATAEQQLRLRGVTVSVHSAAIIAVTVKRVYGNWEIGNGKSTQGEEVSGTVFGVAPLDW
jgi:hypothetical protein